MENLKTQININWYPGHMEKTKREIQKLMPVIDFVIELVDARIPYSSKVVGIESIIKNKPKIFVMTKKDLCDETITLNWAHKYESDGESVVLVNLQDQNDYKIIISKIEEISKKINSSRIEKGMKPKSVRGLVIGIPNVGKSTLINKLAKRNAAGVGNIPGYTKSLSWIKAGSSLLLDSPGILWPKFESEEVALSLSSMSAIKSEILPIDEVAIHILKKLDLYYKDILRTRYGLEKLHEDFEENYNIIGKKIGALSRGGEIDYERVSLFIVNDIKQENVKGITFDRCE